MIEWRWKYVFKGVNSFSFAIQGFCNLFSYWKSKFILLGIVLTYTFIFTFPIRQKFPLLFTTNFNFFINLASGTFSLVFSFFLIRINKIGNTFFYLGSKYIRDFLILIVGWQHVVPLTLKKRKVSLEVKLLNFEEIFFIGLFIFMEFEFTF